MNNSINRRVLIKSLLLLFSNKFSLADSNNHKKFTIIFGSCSNQNNKMIHWKTIIDYKPDLLILLGDNVKLKNDNTIYKVTNMETITENPDEKVYVYITNDPEWSPNIDYEDNEIKNEQKHLYTGNL